MTSKQSWVGIILFPVIILFEASCVQAVRPSPVALDQIDSRCWEGLRHLKSFRFKISYRTDAPAGIEAEFCGVYQMPDREAWDGFYERHGERVRVCLRAKGEIQFAKNDSGWQSQPRGLETKILEQIEQVLYDSKLEFLSEEKGRYRFRFNPQMTLIDPLRAKGLTGILEVDRVTALPVRIYCADDRKSAELDIRLDRFNRAGGVNIPFVPVMRLSLVPNRQRLSRSEQREAATILKQRLTELGIEHRLKWTGVGYDLRIDRMMTGRSLELLASTGRVEVWTGVWADLDSPTEWGKMEGGGVRRVMVAGDAAKQVILQRQVADNQQMDAKADCNLPFKPELVIELKSSPTMTALSDSALLVLVVDGKAFDVTKVISDVGQDPNLASYRRLVFSEVGSEELVRIIAALVNGSPLKESFQVVLSNR